MQRGVTETTKLGDMKMNAQNNATKKEKLHNIIQSARIKGSAAKLEQHQARIASITEAARAFEGLTRDQIFDTYLDPALGHCYRTGYKIGKYGLWVSTRNEKLEKEGRGGVYAAGVELASAMRSGYNTCIYATSRGLTCVKGGNCIFFANMGRTEPVKNKRIARTRLLFENPVHFFALLVHDLDKLEGDARRMRKVLGFRLNVFSDLPWHIMAPWLFEMFPTVAFYDYSKESDRFLIDDIPANYTITASYHEKMSWEVVLGLLGMGVNVAGVFAATKDNMPTHYRGLELIDGEIDDFRFKDPKGSFIALSRKSGLSKANGGTFLLIPDPEFQPYPEKARRALKRKSRPRNKRKAAKRKTTKRKTTK
jgi:hypothetical protein